MSTAVREHPLPFLHHAGVDIDSWGNVHTERGVLRAIAQVRRHGWRLFFATVEVDCGSALVALGEGSFMFAKAAEPGSAHGR